MTTPLRNIDCTIHQLGHSVFHKFGRLQDERVRISYLPNFVHCIGVHVQVCILPIVIHRILAQYQDIQNYKKGELGKLEHSLGETAAASKTS